MLRRQKRQRNEAIQVAVIALPLQLTRLSRQGGEKMERATRSWILKDASAYAAATAKLRQRNLTTAQRLLARRQGGELGEGGRLAERYAKGGSACGAIFAVTTAERKDERGRRSKGRTWGRAWRGAHLLESCGSILLESRGQNSEWEL